MKCEKNKHFTSCGGCESAETRFNEVCKHIANILPWSVGNYLYVFTYRIGNVRKDILLCNS